MENWQNLEPAIRASVFIGAFILFAALEAIRPRRQRKQKRTERWVTSFGMTVLGTLSLRLLFPIVAIGFASIAETNGIGLLNLTDLPFWLEIILAIILLDFAIWAQHVATHHIPVLWAVHKVHHADQDLDASSGFRFHPFEFIFSMLFKLFVVAILGPAALAVFLFELILSVTPLFNHANLNLPTALDKALRQILVTPDMHRVHHSETMSETNSNYGFCLSVWDRMFGTYTAQPALGHTDMQIGLRETRDKAPEKLLSSLTLPFR